MGSYHRKSQAGEFPIFPLYTLILSQRGSSTQMQQTKCQVLHHIKPLQTMIREFKYRY